MGYGRSDGSFFQPDSRYESEAFMSRIQMSLDHGQFQNISFQVDSILLLKIQFCNPFIRKQLSGFDLYNAASSGLAAGRTAVFGAYRTAVFAADVKIFR